MNHETDTDWIKSGPILSGFGDEEVMSYTLDMPYKGYRIIIEEYTNLYGGKTVARLHYLDHIRNDSRSDNDIYHISPSISVWCTGATTDQIVEYLLEAKEKLKDHKLTYNKFPWKNKEKES